MNQDQALPRPDSFRSCGLPTARGGRHLGPIPPTVRLARLTCSGRSSLLLRRRSRVGENWAEQDRWKRGGKGISHRYQITFGSVVFLPFGVAAIVVPFRSNLAKIAFAFTLIAVIVAVAGLGNRVYGIVATVSAMLWFDFFLIRPYKEFRAASRSGLLHA